MLAWTSKGLYCPAGGFHIDPSGAVERAVITHAHSDHARRGSKSYYCAASGAGLLRGRLGPGIAVEAVPYGRPFRLGGVSVSLHPAGHILGSAQVRVEVEGRVWVASGDYKREPDPTCEPFEVVPCDVFVTEATFGTPAFRWDKGADLGAQIHSWWEENAARGLNSVLFAYSLGKTQRVLGLLRGKARRPIHCHPAATAMNDCYLREGAEFADTVCLSALAAGETLVGALVLGPRSVLDSKYAAALGDAYATAFASGWMAQGSRGVEKGFLLSDHADWDDLLRTVRETGARQVYVLHRGEGALVRELRSWGLDARPIKRLGEGASASQLTLF